jgi:hypothetical protein
MHLLEPKLSRVKANIRPGATHLVWRVLEVLLVQLEFLQRTNNLRVGRVGGDTAEFNLEMDCCPNSEEIEVDRLGAASGEGSLPRTSALVGKVSLIVGTALWVSVMLAHLAVFYTTSLVLDGQIKVCNKIYKVRGK